MAGRRPTSPEFGVWAQVNGSWASFSHPRDPVDASWARNLALIREAEALGYEATLVAQQTINPWGDEHDQLEAWTASAALAARTSRIRIITAIKPPLVHPVVLAKQALQIQEIAAGRFALNLVNGWFRPEIERAGLPFLEHDARYAHGREWIAIVAALLTGRRVSFEGRHFTVRDYQLRPAPEPAPPAIYLGGESEPARALAADFADVWFINGQPHEDVARLIRDLAARPRRGRPLRFALSAFVIARETDAEAAAALDEAHRLRRLDADKLAAMAHGADPHVVMLQNARRHPDRIGTNGGTAAGLVGCYDRVAERVLAFHMLGIELFMLQFQPFEAEMRRFAAEIVPRVRRRVAAAA